MHPVVVEHMLAWMNNTISTATFLCVIIQYELIPCCHCGRAGHTIGSAATCKIVPEQQNSYVPTPMELGTLGMRNPECYYCGKKGHR